MLRLLHNVQTADKPLFAYHAVDALVAACDTGTMHVRLKQFRERLGLNQEAMAERMGVSISQISRWEAGASNIPSERLPELAKAYECRIADIFEEEDSRFVPLGPTLYVRGPVQAGLWNPAWQDAEQEPQTFTGRADVSVPLRDRFGVRVEGDSMNSIYPHGTILECVSFLGGVEIENGRRVIVQRRRNGDEYETTVKEYFRDEHGVEWLLPRSNNPAFQAPIRADQPGEGVEQVQIIGIVVGSYRKE